MDYGKLKTYYESIDRVTVPFVYPQYWDKDKEEWVVVDKDNRLPVDARVTGSNTEYVFLEYVELTAGSTVYTEAQDYNGSRLGVNVRFNNAIKHIVRGFLQSKQTGRGVGGIVNIIDSRNTAASQSHGSLQMTTTRVNIGIVNDDVIDTQINLVSIVDFII